MFDMGNFYLSVEAQADPTLRYTLRVSQKRRKKTKTNNNNNKNPRNQGPYAPQGSTSLLPKLSVTSKVSARTSNASVGSRVHFRSSEDVTLLEFTSPVDREYMHRRGKFESETTVVQTSNVGFTSEVSDYLVVHTGPSALDRSVHKSNLHDREVWCTDYVTRLSSPASLPFHCVLALLFACRLTALQSSGTPVSALPPGRGGGGGGERGSSEDSP